MSTKFLGGLVFLCLAIAGIWYFALKEYDYSIRFTTEASPGTVYRKLTNLKPDHSEGIPFSNLLQIINGTRIEWNLSAKDSATQVEANFTSLENSFQERLKLIFGNSQHRREMKELMLQVKKELNEESELYNIKISGKDTLPGATCACISLENEVDQKAFDMMKNIDFLSDYILFNKLEMSGRPRVFVKNYDIENNNIKYDFCFPVKDLSGVKETPMIFFRTISEQNALKAIFHGNYMFSHQAWHELLNYAKMHNLELRNQVLEVFNDNPELGGNALEWEAEIYIPLK